MYIHKFWIVVVLITLTATVACQEIDDGYNEEIETELVEDEVIVEDSTINPTEVPTTEGAGSGDDGDDIALALGITIGVVLFITIVLGGIYCYTKHGSKRQYNTIDDHTALQFGNPLYDSMHDEPTGATGVTSHELVAPGHSEPDKQSRHSYDQDEELDDGFFMDSPGKYQTVSTNKDEYEAF